MKEIWKPIYKYKGIYSISSFGRVKSEKIGANGRWKTGKILIPNIHRGYSYVTLCKNKSKIKRFSTIHSLVAKSFLGKCPLNCEINHKDGNKFNNHADNLEYISHRENMLHAYKKGLINNKGSNHGCAKLTEKQVIEIRKKYLFRIYSLHKLAKIYAVSKAMISLIILRKAWKHI